MAMTYKQREFLLTGVWIAAAPPEDVSTLTAASLRAMSVYNRLASEGVKGGRLWRAIAALQEASAS